MDIGSFVKFEDEFSDTLLGVIISKEVPKCKCKGMGHWIVDFNGDVKKIKVGDKRLVIAEDIPLNPTIEGGLRFDFK